MKKKIRTIKYGKIKVIEKTQKDLAKRKEKKLPRKEIFKFKESSQARKLDSNEDSPKKIISLEEELEKNKIITGESVSDKKISEDKEKIIGHSEIKYSGKENQDNFERKNLENGNFAISRIPVERLSQIKIEENRVIRNTPEGVALREISSGYRNGDFEQIHKDNYSLEKLEGKKDDFFRLEEKDKEYIR